MGYVVGFVVVGKARLLLEGLDDALGRLGAFLLLAKGAGI